MTDLEAAYQECQRTTRRETRNFFYAFILLPPRRRRAIYVACAFCRYCDDAADKESANDKKLCRLAELRNLSDRLGDAVHDMFSHRVSLSTAEKLAVMARSWAGSMWPRRMLGSV